MAGAAIRPRRCRSWCCDFASQAVEKGDLSGLAAPGRQRLKGVKGLQLGGTRGGKASLHDAPSQCTAFRLVTSPLHAAGSVLMGMSLP